MSWSYGSWIYIYMSNQCQSPIKLWVRIPLMARLLDTTLYDKVCQTLAGRLLSMVSSTNKTDRHDMTEILLKLELNNISNISNLWFTVSDYPLDIIKQFLALLFEVIQMSLSIFLTVLIITTSFFGWMTETIHYMQVFIRQMILYHLCLCIQKMVPRSQVHLFTCLFFSPHIYRISLYVYAW